MTEYPVTEYPVTAHPVTAHRSPEHSVVEYPSAEAEPHGVRSGHGGRGSREARVADPWQEYLAAVAALEAVAAHHPPGPPGPPDLAGPAGPLATAAPPEATVATVADPEPGSESWLPVARAELATVYRRIEAQRLHLTELALRHGVPPPQLLPGVEEQAAAAKAVAAGAPALSQALAQAREQLDAGDAELSTPVRQPVPLCWPPTRWLVFVVVVLGTSGALVWLGLALLSMGE